MLTNIAEREELRGLARSRARDYETKTVHPLLTDEATADGWSIDKKNRKSTRLRREKSRGARLEDRVWTLLYRTGFSYLSVRGGADLLLNAKDPSGPSTQIDVVGIDEEIALAIECKSSEQFERRPQFQKELAKHVLIRDRFAHTIHKQFDGPDKKRQIVLAMFLENISLSENDRARAREENVLLFDERDLAYYESLVSHLGPAAKYQLFADMLPGKPISGLTLRVPAVRTRMGGTVCYTFSISPSYLLKISYVSHRSKGKASDVHTYQRMLSKARLNNIRDYIDNDGVFPTNIVINMEPKRIRFDRIQQEEQENGVLGWLEIKPAYKSAWIIDGQHRLFAYSGHEGGAKSRLAVLAFEGLPPSKQAGLFIDINAKQKSVKRSLLQELYAELHWDAEEPEVRVRAIVSKAVQVLDADPDSALQQRIQTADAVKSDTRCITLTSVYGAIEKTEFHIAKKREGHVVEYGPLWAGDNNATLDRTVYVLKQWFNVIRARVPDWWDKGAGEGGGLAMNDGVTTCINVLRSVFKHQIDGGQKLVRLDNGDLFATIRRYADALADHFASFSEEDRKSFRDLRGIQGQTRRTRLCQQAIRNRIPEFNPEGLDQFLRDEKAQTNIRAKQIVDRIETTLQALVVDELKRECGPDESQWWTVGVPKNVRLKVTQRFEEEDGKRGGKECYFDLIDYRAIALDNWELFEPLLGFGKGGSKDKRTTWMAFINEKRKIVSHPSAAVTLSIEDLARLQEYDVWLSKQIVGANVESASGPEP